MENQYRKVEVCVERTYNEAGDSECISVTTDTFNSDGGPGISLSYAGGDEFIAVSWGMWDKVVEAVSDMRPNVKEAHKATQ